MSVEAPLLETRGVEKRFGGLTALSDISIAIRRGSRHSHHISVATTSPKKYANPRGIRRTTPASRSA